ncbi:MAG: hypothetical protein U0264_04695 [Candidatus Kapaibacterium sp.]
MNITYLLCSICLLVSSVQARQDTLRIAPDVRLLRDSTTQMLLQTSINDFLHSSATPIRENPLVLPEDALATSLLLDELQGIGYDKQSKDSGFYTPYLVSIVPRSDSVFLVQVAYWGLRDSMPLLKASIRFIAQKHNHAFTFRSPLPEMTAAWKSSIIGHYTFHYKSTLATAKAKDFQSTITFYDTKLGAKTHPTEFYCASTFDEALQLCGIDYKSDYNGVSHSSLVTKNDSRALTVDGSLTEDFTTYDPHDLFHSRLRNALPAATIYRPVDEGCAYLYGGSWGISWKEILRRFRVYAANNPTANWLELYKDTKNFEEGDKPLTIGYVINALIIQQLERKKGFDAVRQLLQCGRREKGDAKYFEVLEKLTGINESNFNEKVWEMVRK